MPEEIDLNEAEEAALAATWAAIAAGKTKLPKGGALGVRPQGQDAVVDQGHANAHAIADAVEAFKAKAQADFRGG